MRTHLSKGRYLALGCFALFGLLLISQQRRKTESANSSKPAAVGELLLNPGFDQMTAELPAGWVLDPKLAGMGRVQVQSSLQGSKALVLLPNESNTKKDQPFSVGQMISAVSVRGNRLAIRTAMRSEGGAAGFTLVFALAHGKPVASAVFTQTDATPDYVPQDGSLDVPSQADQIIFACATNSTHGSISFKDLHMGGAAPQPRAQNSEGLSATAVIDGAKKVRPIPKELFGTNLEWVRDGNGAWNAGSHAPQPAMVSRTKALGASLVRYPGGGFADYYHWKQGIGADRVKVPYVLDSGVSPIWFGLHELMSFCHTTGTSPLLTVNVVTGTAEEAADWVSYCNRPVNPERARNGSAEPFLVKYWEVGNEQYIKNTETAAVSAPKDAYLPAADYVRTFLKYSSAMKAADPTILVGAIGGLNFGRYPLIHDADWDERLLREAGSQLDFLSVHNAYAPLVVADPQPPPFEDTYRAMLAFPTLVERNVRDLDRQIRTYAPSSADRIRIAVTEWGPLFAYLPNSPWVDHCKTLGSALYVANMMQVFLRSPRVQIANFFKLTDDSFMGWVGANGEPKPSYYALQMFTRHFGTTLISTAVTSPTYDSKAIGMVAAATGVPYLDVVSSLNDDGSHLYLIAVNRSMDSSVSTHLQIHGFRPSQAAVSWTLTAPSLDANNGRDVVGNGWAKQASSDRNPMFDAGRPGTVMPQEGSLTNAAPDFYYTFPAGSVTAIDFSTNF
jgi:alpha-L-arabinofuranosidase